MHFLKDLFDRRPIVDKLVELLGRERVEIMNGIIEGGHISCADHVKCRHLKITIGRYSYGYEGSSEMWCPLTEIWIDKNRKIVSIGSDFGRSNDFSTPSFKPSEVDRRCLKLFQKLEVGDPFITNIDEINNLISWFYEGPTVYFPFHAYNAVGHYGYELKTSQKTREAYAKDKIRQKHLIHQLNCSK